MPHYSIAPSRWNDCPFTTPADILAAIAIGLALAWLAAQGF